MEKNNLTTEQKIHQFVFQKTLITGLSGGFIWSIVWLIMYGLNMVEVNPTLFWDKLFLDTFNFVHWYMYILTIVLYGVLSTILALFYFLCFKKIAHWFMGAVYGIFIWFIFAFMIPTLFYSQNAFTIYSSDTHVGLICLFFLYGLFIGYTISFDYETLLFEYKE